MPIAHPILVLGSMLDGQSGIPFPASSLSGSIANFDDLFFLAEGSLFRDFLCTGVSCCSSILPIFIAYEEIFF